MVFSYIFEIKKFFSILQVGKAISAKITLVKTASGTKKETYHTYNIPT